MVGRHEWNTEEVWPRVGEGMGGDAQCAWAMLIMGF